MREDRKKEGGGRKRGGGREGKRTGEGGRRGLFHPPRQSHCRENGGCVASQDSKFKLFIIVSISSDQLRTGLQLEMTTFNFHS